MEPSRTSYCPLLEVQVLHRYFLNIGQAEGKVLDGLERPDEVQAQALRQLYDVRRFLRFEPDAATQALLGRHRLHLHPTREGFRLAAAAPYDFATQQSRLGQPLPSPCRLRFLVYCPDALFPLYTDLDLKALASQQPQPNDWMGSCFALSNANFRYQDSRRYRCEEVANRSAKWGEPVARPLLALTLLHEEQADWALHGPNGELPATPVRYELVLNNRTTLWKHKGEELGTYPLLHYGGIVLGGGLPNPTAATTCYEKRDPTDPSPGADRQVVSYIY